MVAISEVVSDVFQAVGGQLPSQEHRHATGSDDTLLASLALEVRGSQVEVLGHSFGDRLELWFVTGL